MTISLVGAVAASEHLSDFSGKKVPVALSHQPVRNDNDFSKCSRLTTINLNTVAGTLRATQRRVRCLRFTREVRSEGPCQHCLAGSLKSTSSAETDAPQCLGLGRRALMRIPSEHLRWETLGSSRRGRTGGWAGPHQAKAAAGVPSGEVRDVLH